MIKVICTYEYPTRRCWLMIIVGLVYISTTPVWAQPITFTKLADTDTPAPDGGGNFTFFNEIAIDDNTNTIIFNGWKNFGYGFYKITQGSIELVINNDTPIPDYEGTISVAFDPIIHNNTIIFWGRNDQFQSGIYWNQNGISTIVNNNTLIPGSEEQFSKFLVHDIHNNIVAFRGVDQSNFIFDGIYTYENGTVSIVANRNTPIPNSSDNFDRFAGGTGSYVSIEDNKVGFYGRNESSSIRGIYLYSMGNINVVADTNTPVPNSNGNFTQFAGPRLDHGNVAFRGWDANNREGIYASRNGNLEMIADVNTPIPENVGTFCEMGSLAFDNGNIAFSAFIESKTSYFQGTYLHWKGNLIKVKDATDRLDGKRILGIRCSPWSLSGNKLVLVVSFVDGSYALYLATINDCNNNGLDDDCDIDCGESAGVCDVPGCGESTDANSNGIPDECDPQIPTLSQWGLAIFALLILSTGSIMIRSKQMAV